MIKKEDTDVGGTERQQCVRERGNRSGREREKNRRER